MSEVESLKCGFGVVDPKGELFSGILGLLWQCLEELDASDPSAATELRDRIIIIDFSARDPLTSFNILARDAGIDADFFATNRADLLLDLLPSGDGMSLTASALLRRSLRLLSDSGLPITWLPHGC